MTIVVLIDILCSKAIAKSCSNQIKWRANLNDLLLSTATSYSQWLEVRISIIGRITSQKYLNIHTKNNLVIAKMNHFSFFSSSINVLHVYTTVRERSVMLNLHVFL